MANTTEVESLYINLLGRQPGQWDPAAIQAWVNSGQSIDVIAQQIAGSPEGQLFAPAGSPAPTTTEVESLYVNLLGRQPGQWDPAAIQEWVNSGQSIDVIAQQIAGSPEGQLFAPAGSPAPTATEAESLEDAVTRFYGTALGRMPTQNALDYWVGLITSLGQDRLQIAEVERQISESAEAQAFTAGGGVPLTQLQITQLQLDATEEFLGVELGDFQDTPEQIERDRLLSSIRTQGLEFAHGLQPFQQELLGQAFAVIRSGGQPTPEQNALLDQAAAAALQKGESDINRVRSQNLEALREQLAPQLGLRPADTPILDRGSKVAEEAMRQFGQLSNTIAMQRANAGLQYPLQANAQTFGQIANQQSMISAAKQFQEQLGQQAFTNRLNLGNSIAQNQIGLISAVNPGLGSLQSSLSNLQLGGAQQTTTSPFITGSDLGQMAIGAGTVIAGSSRRWKRNPANSDERNIDHNTTLERVTALPVERWRYNENTGLEAGDHIGPYAEDFRESFGIGDGSTINIIDALGVALSAIKGLAEKVERLEND